MLAKPIARVCILYVTGAALALVALQMWVMIGAKALYDPSGTVQFLPFNALTIALYSHWTTFRWVWPILPDGHGPEVFLSVQSVLTVIVALVALGVISVAKTGFTAIREVRFEKRKDRMLGGASRFKQIIQNVVVGGNFHVAQGSSVHPKASNPSDSVWGKLLLGIAIPVCVAAIMMLFGLHP